MSLFQAREWWSHKPDQAEECHEGCLCVANIDNDPKGAEKVITGSFQGYLRIYNPRQQGYKVDDLMEFQLDEPILQIEAGRFVNQGNKLSLAVLHPRKLVVYNVVAIGANGKMLQAGTSEQASYYDLNKSYEHKLERTAYNFCYGPFGGVYGKDFICVQSLDGQLSFLEQENFAFARFLSSGFLVPGPICYVAKIDSFVTCNSNMDLECYKYQTLGSSHGAEKKSNHDDDEDLGAGGAAGKAATTGGKKIQVDWSINLGEAIQQVFVARYSRSLAASNVDILVLGQTTLFTLKENGTIRLQKRLDYNPSTCVTYTHTESEGEKDVGGSNQNLLIATHQSSCMIYKDMQLVWAARTTSVPIAVRVATFAGVKGFVVTLNDLCELQISYLGTDPPITGVNASESNKELDYEAMDEEHRALLKVIKQASSDSLVEPKDKIVLRAQVGQVTASAANSTAEADVYTESQQSGSGGSGRPDAPDEDVCVRDDRTGQMLSVLVRVYLTNTSKVDLENITLTLGYSPAFRCSAGRHLVLPVVRGGSKTPLVVALRFRALRGPLLPADLNLLILASYVTPSNEPRTARLDTKLPLGLATRVVAPLKNCQYMFTLDTNRSPPSLVDVFPDLLDQNVMAANSEVARTAANVLTLVFHASPGVGPGASPSSAASSAAASSSGGGGASAGPAGGAAGGVGGCDVTILVSKKSGRYRLQSSVFEALNLVTSELVVRLTGFYAAEDAKTKTDEPPFQVQFKDLLPLHDYFLGIDRHFGARQAVAAVRERLEKLAHQFRVIQKRLLVRYKDKNPAPLLQLDTLLHETYQQMCDGSSEMSGLVAGLREVSNALSCSTSLMLLLIKFKYDLDEPSFEVLRAHLTPSVALFDRNDALGWEEVVDASSTSLLRGALAKPTGGKDSAAAAAAAAAAAVSSSMAQIEPLKDVTKLKRHIQIVCDRLAKGIKLVKRETSSKAAAAPAAAAAGGRAPVPQQAPAQPPKQIPVPSQQQQAPAPPRRRQQEQGQETLREEEEEHHQ